MEYGYFCHLEVFSKDAFTDWVVTQPMPDHGIYLESCKFVEYGYFCNLEAFSKAAFADWVVTAADARPRYLPCEL